MSDTMSDAFCDFESCYRAASSRDTRFDGLFFTAVTTTRIYCRSVCPARTPARTSCRFYRTAVQAERDGFRPCLRCRPELAPGRPRFAADLGESILARLEAHALGDDSLEALAETIGLSCRHMRRILHDQFGVTPVAIVQTQRLLFAKKLLHETRLSMTDVALAAGFKSVRRFNALFRERYRMAPSAVRRAERPGVAATHALTLRLAFRPPLAWDAALTYLAGRATPGVEAVREGRYGRTVCLVTGSREYRGWVQIRAKPGASFLTAEVSDSLVPVLRPLTFGLRTLFDLDAQPEQIDQQLGTDPALARLVRATPGLRVLGAWDPFELALRAVLGQQISVAGATTLAGRLARQFGEPLSTPYPELYLLAPSAERLAAASVPEVASVGLPQARAATIVGLARFAAAGGFRFAPGTSLEEMVARLAALSGIGNWTAQYIAMRALGQPDAFPAGDLGLKRALPALDAGSSDAGPASEAALGARALAWKPWRAYAAAHLWRFASLARG